jgi:hypothetical protein
MEQVIGLIAGLAIGGAAGAAIAQARCPEPEDMSTGVRLRVTPEIHADFWQDPDLAGGILSETYVETQLYASKAMAAGLYVTTVSTFRSGSEDIELRVDFTYDRTVEIPAPESSWSIGVTLDSLTTDEGYSDVWTFFTGPVETILFGTCPVRVFFVEYREAIAPNDPTRHMYLVDFGFMVDARPESQDPDSIHFQPLTLEPI